MCKRKYTLEEQQIIKTFKQENPHICFYCNKHLEESEITVDHKIPVSRAGLTIDENLTIACCKCNKEKDDMTIEEYQIYKQRQKEIHNNEASKLISELVITYNNAISRISEVNEEYNYIEKEIFQLEQDIMLGDHNAYEGYWLTNRLKELLLKKEEIKILKTSYNRLGSALGNYRKNILEIKDTIQNEINNNSRAFLKRYAVKMCKKKSKVVNINRLKVAN